MIHTAVLSSSCRCRATPTGMFGLQMPTPAPPATLPNRSEGEAAELPCVRYTRGASAEHANLMAVAADVVRGGVNPHKSSRSRFPAVPRGQCDDCAEDGSGRRTP